MLVDVVYGPLFHDLTLVHHEHAVADRIAEIQVVGDEQVAQIQFVSQVEQQLQDLPLDGHVQRRDRLVRHDEAGSLDEGCRDGHPLLLTAGQLVRLVGDQLVIQSDSRHHIQHPALAFGCVVFSEDAQRLFQDPAHCLGRVQAAVGVLEHHLGPLRIMLDLSRDLRVVQHAQDRLGQGGFAAAGFPDQTDDLAVVDVERHVRKRLEIALLSEHCGVLVHDGQVIHFEHAVTHGVSSWGWQPSAAGCIRLSAR